MYKTDMLEPFESLSPIQPTAKTPETAVYTVFVKDWVQGNTRFCEYLDGRVIQVGFGQTCPLHLD